MWKLIKWFALYKRVLTFSWIEFLFFLSTLGMPLKGRGFMTGKYSVAYSY